jgi:uncharacterized membrane protein YkoI
MMEQEKDRAQENTVEQGTKKEQIQDMARRIFSPAHLKKAAALVVVCAILGGGGAWYHHQQKQLEHQQVMQARTAMIQNQASQRNLNLLDEEQAKALAAQAVGVDEGNLTYKKIALINGADRNNKEKDKHKDKEKEIKNAKRMLAANPEQNQNNQAGQDGATDSNAAATKKVAVTDFQPIYKVDMKADKVEYDVRLDAVTGNVLKADVG